MKKLLLITGLLCSIIGGLNGDQCGPGYTFTNDAHDVEVQVGETCRNIPHHHHPTCDPVFNKNTVNGWKSTSKSSSDVCRAMGFGGGSYVSGGICCK